MNQLIFDLLYSLTGQSVLVDRLIVFCAQTLPWLVVATLGIYWLVYWYWTRVSILSDALFVATSALVSWVLSVIIKSWQFGIRPFLSLPEGATLLTHTSPEAFPSGHASFFFALALALYVADSSGPVRHWYLIGALIIGLARVATGLHWPVDILGGFFVALITVAILSLLVPRRPVRKLA